MPSCCHLIYRNISLLVSLFFISLQRFFIQHKDYWGRAWGALNGLRADANQGENETRADANQEENESKVDANQDGTLNGPRTRAGPPEVIINIADEVYEDALDHFHLNQPIDRVEEDDVFEDVIEDFRGDVQDVDDVTQDQTDVTQD